MKVLGAVQVTYPCHKDIMFSLTILLMQSGEKFDPLVQWLARGAVKLVVCRL